MNSGANVYFSYDEQGKKYFNTELKLKGMTPEEEIEYDKKVWDIRI